MTDTTGSIRRCRTCGNGVGGFFCTLDGVHLDRVDQAKAVRRYRRGDVVFREGTPANEVHCIQSGSIKVYKLGRDGEEVIIRLLGPGEIMGYRPLFAGDDFAATARALEDSVVCAVGRDVMITLLRESPDLALRLLEKLAKELRVSEDQMVQRAVESVPQRTARFLLWLHTPEPGGRRLDSALRREDMALMIGTTPETLSRTLHEFARLGIVDLERRSVRIRRPQELHDLSVHGLPLSDAS